MNKNSTILITGGAGFIGSHLAELLVNKGFKNILNNIVFLRKDINNINASHLKKYKIKVVIHLAALADIVPSINNPSQYFKSNVTGTINLLEVMRELSIKKIIYAASSSCYGLAKTPTSEEMAIDTQYPYAFTKYVGEQSIIHWSKVYKINYISLRLFNVYGPRSRTNGTYGAVFGTFLSQYFNNKPLTIVGNGKQKRDFIFIEDVVACFFKIMNSSQKNQIFNVGANNPKAINSIAKILKYTNIVKIPKRPGEPFITNANINKIKKAINWFPKTSLKQGVKIMVQDRSIWKKAPLWNKSSIKNATKDWFKYLK